jgi:hypothetical protein
VYVFAKRPYKFEGCCRNTAHPLPLLPRSRRPASLSYPVPRRRPGHRRPCPHHPTVMASSCAATVAPRPPSTLILARRNRRRSSPSYPLVVLLWQLPLCRAGTSASCSSTRKHLPSLHPYEAALSVTTCSTSPPVTQRSVIHPKRIYFPEHFCCCFSSNFCVLDTTNTD